MALPFFEDVTILMTVLAIGSLISTQLLFSDNEKDFTPLKRNLVIAAQILGIIAIALLVINVYFIIYTAAPEI